MPHNARDRSYHGGNGWRFRWSQERLHRTHELGRAFGLTEDSAVPDDPGGAPAGVPIPEPTGGTPGEPDGRRNSGA